MSYSWNNVTVYGSSAEISRFRRLCIELPPGSDPQNVSGGWDGYEAYIGYQGVMPAGAGGSSGRIAGVYASNYREEAPKAGSWSFAFDTEYRFPDDVFEDLAALFHALHFYCDCIDSLDDYMGCGWFNSPSGGETFRQDMEVPADYWVGNSEKRTPEEATKHTRLIKALLDEARILDRRASTF